MKKKCVALPCTEDRWFGPLGGNQNDQNIVYKTHQQSFVVCREKAAHKSLKTNKQPATSEQRQWPLQEFSSQKQTNNQTK